MEDVREDDKTNGESDTFLEGFCEADRNPDIQNESVNTSSNADNHCHSFVVSKDSGKDTEDDRDKKHEDPEVDLDDFAENVDVVDRNDRFPTCFTSFFEDFPVSDDEKDPEN